MFVNYANSLVLQWGHSLVEWRSCEITYALTAVAYPKGDNFIITTHYLPLQALTFLFFHLKLPISTIYSKLFKRPKSNLKKSICLKKLNTLLSGINWKCLLFLKSPENNTIWQFQEKNPLNLLASKLFFKHFKMKTCLKTCTLMFWITTLCTNVVQRDTKGDAYTKLLNVHMYIHFSEY